MNKSFSKEYLTGIIIAGILISYILQMAPSPLLTTLRDEFELQGRDSLLNLSVSVIFPVLIVFSLAGGTLTKQLGLKRLFTICLAFMATGTLANIFIQSFAGFLVGRLIFAIGFGLGIPFIGAAIMNGYNGKSRDIMNTVNAVFPFLGTLISFGLLVPLTRLMKGSWRTALGLWGFLLFLLLPLWFFGTSEEMLSVKEEGSSALENRLYQNLLSRREIRLLCIIFSCDYFCYSYIAVILPTFLQEQGSMSNQAAGIAAAIIFPVFGLIGCAAGGLLNTFLGRCKPSLVFGQLLKLVGVFAAVLAAPLSIWLSAAGFALFGFGNGLWMPAMYSIPMRLPGMTAEHTGAAFALISSFGFLFGFISPSVGGWLTGVLSILSADANIILRHAFGLRMSLLFFGTVNILSLLCSIQIHENNPEAVS